MKKTINTLFYSFSSFAGIANSIGGCLFKHVFFPFSIQLYIRLFLRDKDIFVMGKDKTRKTGPQCSEKRTGLVIIETKLKVDNKNRIGKIRKHTVHFSKRIIPESLNL